MDVPYVMTMTKNVLRIDFLDKLYFEVRRLPFEIASDLVDFFLGGGQHFAFLEADQRPPRRRSRLSIILSENGRGLKEAGLRASAEADMSCCVSRGGRP